MVSDRYLYSCELSNFFFCYDFWVISVFIFLLHVPPPCPSFRPATLFFLCVGCLLVDLADDRGFCTFVCGVISRGMFVSSYIIHVLYLLLTLDLTMVYIKDIYVFFFSYTAATTLYRLSVSAPLLVLSREPRATGSS